MRRPRPFFVFQYISHLRNASVSARACLPACLRASVRVCVRACVCVREMERQRTKIGGIRPNPASRSVLYKQSNLSANLFLSRLASWLGGCMCSEPGAGGSVRCLVPRGGRRAAVFSRCARGCSLRSFCLQSWSAAGAQQPISHADQTAGCALRWRAPLPGTRVLLAPSRPRRPGQVGPVLPATGTLGLCSAGPPTHCAPRVAAVRQLRVALMPALRGAAWSPA